MSRLWILIFGIFDGLKELKGIATFLNGFK